MGALQTEVCLAVLVLDALKEGFATARELGRTSGTELAVKLDRPAVPA